MNLDASWVCALVQRTKPGMIDGNLAPGEYYELRFTDPNRHVRVVPDIVTVSTGVAFARPAVASMIRATLTAGADRQFTLRVENVSNADTLATSLGGRAITVTPVLWAIHAGPNVLFELGAAPSDAGIEALAESGNADTLNNTLRLQRGIASPLSRGAYVVHAGGNPLFVEATIDRSLGLEQLAEDGDPSFFATSLADSTLVPETESFGTFDTGPCMPGDAYLIEFKARPGDRLSFATAFAASNDWFISPASDGMELFNGTLPRWGEITNEFHLYDLGTELDEELDVGANVGTQQTAKNLGRIDRTTDVREVGRDRYDVPLTRHVRISLTPPTK